MALAKQTSYYPQWCQLCFLYSDLTNLIVAIKIRSFPHSRFITGFVTRVTRWVPHVEQGLLTLSVHLSTCCSIFSLLCNVLKIVLSFVFWPLCCLSFDLRLLITPLASSNFSYTPQNTLIVLMASHLVS